MGQPLSSLTEVDVRRTLDEANKYSIVGSRVGDSRFSFEGSPPFIYLEGNPPPKEVVAIVGTRRCDRWARSATRHLSEGLARAGISTISGLAKGVDGSAHEGSLAGNVPTWAVLGTAIDRTYPAGHRELRQRILEQGGGILSEFPPGVPTQPSHFPRRNRIVSGLSSLVVAIQAGPKSGTLHTIRWALDQGVEVQVVPGPLGDSAWAGSSRMLEEGATPCLGVHSVLDWLGYSPRFVPPSTDPIATLLESGAMTEDTLESHWESDTPFFAALTQAELAGAIRRRRDGRWETTTT